MNSYLANSGEISALSFKEIFSNVFTQWYYYVALIIVVVGIIVFTTIVKPKFCIELSDTKRITFVAMLVAITVVANAFSIGSNLWKVSFVPFVCFIAGVMFGPTTGFAVGLIGDLIAGIIAPQGVYNPIIAIASGLWGFIPGVVFAYSRKHPVIQTVISFFIGYIVCSVFLNTVATYLMYLKGVSTKYPTLISYVLYRALPTFVTTFAINTVLAIAFYNILPHLPIKFSDEGKKE